MPGGENTPVWRGNLSITEGVGRPGCQQGLHGSDLASGLTTNTAGERVHSRLVLRQSPVMSGVLSPGLCWGETQPALGSHAPTPASHDLRAADLWDQRSVVASPYLPHPARLLPRGGGRGSDSPRCAGGRESPAPRPPRRHPPARVQPSSPTGN